MDFHLFPDSPHPRVFPAPRRDLSYFLKQGTSLMFFLGNCSVSLQLARLEELTLSRENGMNDM